MLKNLNIKNLILIESAQVEFKEGFNVITGETGAGKSLFLSALKLLSGHKAPPNLIRQGADRAVIEAEFHLDTQRHHKVFQILESIDIESDHELIIQREILQGGKSKARINGTLVNVKDLQQLGNVLLQLHGQSEQVLLRDTSTHGHLLDTLAPTQELLLEYKSGWKEYHRIQKLIQTLKEESLQNASQQDFFRFQYDELKKADLKPDEEDKLEAELSSLESAGELSALKDQSLEAILDGDSSVQFKLKLLIKTFEPYARDHSQISESLNSLKEALPFVEEAGYIIRNLNIPDEVSPYEIDEKNSRLALLQKLKRKFSLDVNGLIALRDQREEQLQTVDNFDLKIADLEFEKQAVMKGLWVIARQLHEIRTQVATDLDHKVTTVLSQLGMNHAEFQTQLSYPKEESEESLNSAGANQIEFQVRTNQGSEFQSLKKGISGGELSRVMLALKSALAHNDQTPILLFDEVDAGISGEVGHSIGTCMKSLGEFHQILCITHLHQVAVQAHQQLTVSKSQQEQTTLTSIENLTEQTRIVEVARMLGGASDSNWLKQAERLLAEG